MNNGVSSENNDIYYVYQSFYKLDMNYILIPLTNYNDVICKINMCKGIIMQGGDDYELVHLKIIKYLYDNDIPLLAICMSMQAMGVLFGGYLVNIDNHKDKNKYSHKINIRKNTLLHRIINKDSIYVNSSHKMCIVNTNLVVSSYSNCIESIEDTDKKFFLGVQWHPEKMVEYDKLEYKIFDYFKKVCENYENR